MDDGVSLAGERPIPSLPMFSTGKLSVPERGRLCMISAPRRCGSFWMMHWEKSRSRVWRSGTLASSLEMLEVTVSHCSWKNWLA